MYAFQNFNTFKNSHVCIMDSIGIVNLQQILFSS